MLLWSCSSPYSDGEKAAKIFNACEEKYEEDLESKINEFIDNFNDYAFSTRIEARQTIESIISKAREEYENNLKDAEYQYLQLLDKYKRRYADSRDFESGFDEMRNQGYFDTIVNASLKLKVDALIKTIIPPTPSIEKIKKDLSGHSWQDKKDGYFGTEKRIIKSGSVKDIEIVSEKIDRDNYFLNAVVSIQERPGSSTFRINSDIKYCLGEASNDWTIDFFSSNSVEIEKTGQFNKYITSEITAPWITKQLEIENHSDASLIVGGVVLEDGYPAEWTKFAVEIAPNSKKVIGGLLSNPHYNDILEYEIHFVERK